MTHYVEYFHGLKRLEDMKPVGLEDLQLDRFDRLAN
jgi:hypothetical protein